MSNQQYLAALMIFFVSYTVFETPSNYMLKKFRPSRWIAFLMFAWGAMTMILGGVRNFGGLVAVREARAVRRGCSSATGTTRRARRM